jgi:hypothetical protein
MPGPVLHLGATVICMHAGQAVPTAPFPRVLVSGQPVATIASPYAVAGCALTGTTVPPCVTGQFVTGSVRVLAGGVPLVLMTSQAVCTPTGTGLQAVVSQMRVMAT